MITVIALFVILVFLLLVGMSVAMYLMWQKVSTYLAWNTNYQTAEYQKSVTHPKKEKLFSPAKSVKQKGRNLENTDDLVDLVDLADLDWEKGYKALEDIANGN